jgi:dCMP deaminase
MIINCGIKKIYYFEDYPDPLAIELLDEAGVELIRLDF